MHVDFQGFRTLSFRHFRKWGQRYYKVLFSPLPPFHWPQSTWPWMTLSGHFTLNFHYYEQSFEKFLKIITVEYVYIAEKLQIFRRRYIVGTLTNKANISI